jgi:SAM-dependent methyltransferase
MKTLKKKLIEYSNSNLLHSNFSQLQLVRHADNIIGYDRWIEITDIINKRADSLSNHEKIDLVAPIYQSLKSYEEAATLQCSQGSMVLESFNLILEYLYQTKPKKILELGCYTGIYANYIAQEFPDSDVIGVDMEDNLIEFGQGRFNGKNLNLIKSSYHNFSRTSNSKHDFIFSMCGYGSIDTDINCDHHNIRSDHDYKENYKHWSNFFGDIDLLSYEKCDLVMHIRLNSLRELLFIFDAAQSNNYTPNLNKLVKFNFNEFDVNDEGGNNKINKTGYILFFDRNISKKISLSDFFKYSLEKNILINDPLRIFYKYEIMIKDPHESRVDQDYDNGRKNNIHLGSIDNSFYVFLWDNYCNAVYEEFTSTDEALRFIKDRTGVDLIPSKVSSNNQKSE